MEESHKKIIKLCQKYNNSPEKMRLLLELHLSIRSYVCLSTALHWAREMSDKFEECWSVYSGPENNPNGWWVVPPEMEV